MGGGLAVVGSDGLRATVIQGLLARNPGLDVDRIAEVVFGNADGAGEENRNPVGMAGRPSGHRARRHRGASTKCGLPGVDDLV